MRELVNDPGVRRHLESRGRKVLAKAVEDAPVASGDFRDSLRLISTTTDRVSVRIGSDDPAAMLIEARTGVLGRALDEAGGGPS
jgi:hypothetical protein